MDVKTSLGSRPVAVAHLLVSFNHWFADPDLMVGRASSSSPTLFPGEDSAVVEQFLKGASLPLEELVRHGWVLQREEGGEKEEAQPGRRAVLQARSAKARKPRILSVICELFNILM